ncbi:MAG TPA: immunity protein YezG family protein [Thermobifida alba]|nr:immunity protein YezG family protein [Thermobifida alba]
MAVSRFRRGHLSLPEQQQILTRIGTKLLAEVPEDWERVTYFIQSVVDHSSAEVVVEFPDGTSRRESLPAEVFSLTDELRAGMYQEGKGTWFSMRYVISRPGKFNVDFDYDEDPGITFPTSQGFTKDLRYFPREEANIPEWLREKLREEAEGRADQL